jgi:hypothetical protein
MIKNMNISFSQTLKCFVWLFFAIGITFVSCKKGDLFKPSNIGTIRFAASSYTIENNTLDPLKIVLPLSLPLEEDATAVITVDAQSTIQSSEYTTSPGIPNTGLVVKLAKGATEASFDLSSLNNFEGERTLVLKITSATGGLTVANTNASTVVTIKGNPIILPEIRLSETGIAFGNVTAGTTTPAISYSVTGTKLTSNINLTVSPNFQISADNVSFGNSLVVPFADANAGGVTVYVRFLATTGTNQTITGNITHTSAGASDINLALSGVEYGNAASGVLLMKDDFSYGSTAGDLKTVTTNWSVYSGTVNPVKYAISGLSFPSYAGSAIGGSAVMENGSGSREDMVRTFTSQNSGSVYAAQLVNVASAPTGGGFFLSLVNATSSPTFYNRVFIKDNGGSLNFGLGRTSTSTIYGTTNYSFGTTYLVITRYDFSGASYMYILSPGSISAIEPATADITNSAGTGATVLLGIGVRQNTETPLLATFDGIRIATSWKEAVGL